MGKMKALWQAEQEKNGVGLNFDDDGGYVNEEVKGMREEFNKHMNSEIVRDEYDLWVTHDGQGDY
jgi:hypothetical protein